MLQKHATVLPGAQVLWDIRNDKLGDDA